MFQLEIVLIEVGELNFAKMLLHFNVKKKIYAFLCKPICKRPLCETYFFQSFNFYLGKVM